MRKCLLSIFLLLNFISLSVAEDKGPYNYIGLTQVRDAADEIQAFTLTVGTTSQYLNLKRNTKSITICNDSANTLYVDFSKTTALNVTGTTAITTASSNMINFNNANAQYLAVNSNIVLNEGDGNDGAYTIIKDEDPNFYLDRNLSVTHAGNQDFKIQSIPVLTTEKPTFVIATNTIAFLASGSSSSIRVMVSYQKGS